MGWKPEDLARILASNPDLGLDDGTVPEPTDEHGAQAVVVAWARAAAETVWPGLAFLAAVPNGGHRHPAVARRMAEEGVSPGVPDLFLPLPGGRVLWIEMKTLSGRLSAGQRRWHDHLRSLGHRVIVARSAQEAIDAIMEEVNRAKELHNDVTS